MKALASFSAEGYRGLARREQYRRLQKSSRVKTIGLSYDKEPHEEVTLPTSRRNSRATKARSKVQLDVLKRAVGASF